MILTHRPNVFNITPRYIFRVYKSKHNRLWLWIRFRPRKFYGITLLFLLKDGNKSGS